MNKEDIEIYLENSKYKLQDTVKEQKVVITRKLQDMSFLGVFFRHFWQNAIATLVICIVFCFLCSLLFNFTCSGAIDKIVADVAFNINAIKSDTNTSLQETTKIKSALLQGYDSVVDHDDNLIKDAAVVLYNITNNKIEAYSTHDLLVNSDELTYWYRNEVDNDSAMPIIAMSEDLRQFALKNTGKQLVITKMAIDGVLLYPETVEARKGKKAVDTFEEVVYNEPDRTQYTKDVMIELSGTDFYGDVMSDAAKYKFISDINGVKVEYEDMGHSYKTVSRQFTTNGTTYEVDVIYDYAGLGGYGFYVFFCILFLWGIAVVITLMQVKKDKEF